mmetsp:Transcript_139084/g.242001  ORF Transcript_139084/g.242001 Transcript_139084/m.242001 type:complete len:177 (+) Transcript_139084:95-625(+)
MGAQSCKCTERSKFVDKMLESEDNDDLTEKEVQTVEETWGLAAGLGVETVGVLLFKNIFEIAPEALQLFSFRNEKDLYESPALIKHATKVVLTVDTAVKMLRQLEALVPVLEGLALKHVGYGVLPPHYDVVGQALIKTLGAGLGAGFTKQVERAWLKVWKLIASTMIGATLQTDKK